MTGRKPCTIFECVVKTPLDSVNGLNAHRPSLRFVGFFGIERLGNFTTTTNEFCVFASQAVADVPKPVSGVSVSNITPRSCVLRWEKPEDGGSQAFDAMSN